MNQAYAGDDQYDDARAVTIDAADARYNVPCRIGVLSPAPLRLIRLAAWLVRLHTDHADLKRKRPGSSQYAPMNKRSAMRTGLMAHHRHSALLL